MKSLIFFTFQQSSHRRVWRIFAQIPTIRIMQRGGKNGISIETDQFFKRAGTPPSLPSVCVKSSKISTLFLSLFSCMQMRHFQNTVCQNTDFRSEIQIDENTY